MFSSMAAASFAFTDWTVDGTNLTTYTFSARNIGAAVAGRKVPVLVKGRAGGGNRPLTVTVGGIGAALVCTLTSVGSDRVSIWQAIVPTGTTADIVVVWDAAMASCGIGVGRAINAALGSSAVATTESDPSSASIAAPAGGFVVGVAGNGFNSATFTWTELTEGYDEIVEGASSHTGAAKDYAAAATPTVTCTRSAAAESPTMALAAWEGASGFAFLTPTSGDWSGNTGDYSITSGQLDKGGTNDNGVYLSAADFSGDFDIVLHGNNGVTLQGNQYWGGVYPVSEHGTLSLTVDHSGLNSMTDSFWFDGDTGAVWKLYKGGSNVNTTGATDGYGPLRIKRVAGVISFWLAGVLAHTFASTYTGTMRFTITARNVAITYSGIIVAYV